jgi:hypothetical protein
MKLTIKGEDLQNWIQYNTWIKVIPKDIEFELLEESDTELLKNNYASR